ncbi:MAG: outer membrane lipoprotein chaperone LolA [Halioglobus sp.]|jgi:outer membrane lipoprotein carrier protein
MTRLLIIVALGLCLVAGAVRGAENAADDLLRRLAGIRQMQGDFVQRQYDRNDTLLSESRGSFRLLRPGYFAWDIDSPDSQLIIADPTYLWHYDRDLETVTRRPVAGREEMSPLQVLGGDEAVLRERFDVRTAGAGAYLLAPVSGDPGFRQLTLQFEGKVVSAMDIVDKLNQRVHIDFEKVDTASALQPEDFAFSPPEGVDLFYYDE